MQADGTTFTSDRAPSELKGEFLASSDNWFRPTTVTTGPDGAIYVADMYRLVIEHPEWIPKEWQDRLNLRAGDDKGRIYRISPIHRQRRAIPRLDKLSTEQLAAALDSPSGWQRDMAHRMLLWRGDEAAAGPLSRMVAESKNPAARMHAVWVLEGLGELSDEALAKALDDPDPDVSRQAVRLCAAHSDIAVDHYSGQRFLQDKAAGARLRLAWAYVLGDIAKPWATTALADLARSAESDRFLMAAVLSSLNEQNLEEFARKAVKRSALSAPLLTGIIRTANGTGKTEALAPILTALTGRKDGGFEAWQLSAMAALLDSLEQSKTPLAKVAESAGVKDAPASAGAMLEAARGAVKDESAEMAVRTAAVGLLLRDSGARDEDLALVREALSPQSPRDLQTAAIAALSGRRESRTPELLVGALKSFTPEVRGAALDALLARPQWAGALLDAVERKEIAAADLDAARRQRLLQSADTGIRQRAGKLLSQAVNPDRQKVIDSFAESARLKGDIVRGHEVYARACAICHRAGGEGKAVGPDLAAVGDKTAQGLLIAILDPNRAVEPRYFNYIAETTDGDTHTGILVSELDSAIKLLGPDGASVSVPRRQLKELRSSQTSLMPEGLESGMSAQDFADLIAFVQTAR
jgi:putative heme-binding domain-containing protein